MLAHVDTWGASTVTDSHLYAGLSAFGAIALDHNTIRGGVRVDDSQRSTPMDIVDNLILASPGAGIDINVAFDFDRVGGTIQGNDIRNSVGDGILIHGQGANGLGELARHRQPPDRQRRRRHLLPAGQPVPEPGRHRSGRLRQELGPPQRRPRHRHP